MGFSGPCSYILVCDSACERIEVRKFRYQKDTIRNIEHGPFCVIWLKEPSLRHGGSHLGQFCERGVGIADRTCRIQLMIEVCNERQNNSQPASGLSLKYR